MPVFAFIGRDGPKARELRPVLRPEHLAGLEGLEAEGRVRHAGPLLDSDGGPVGSLVLFEAATLREARAFAENDPYVTGGVFESYEVRETKAVIPR